MTSHDLIEMIKSTEQPIAWPWPTRTPMIYKDGMYRPNTRGLDLIDKVYLVMLMQYKYKSDPDLITRLHYRLGENASTTHMVECMLNELDKNVYTVGNTYIRIDIPTTSAGISDMET